MCAACYIRNVAKTGNGGEIGAGSGESRVSAKGWTLGEMRPAWFNASATIRFDY